MSITLSEGGVKAVYDQLVSDLDAYITQVNTEVTDGYTIDPAYQIYDFVPPIAYLGGFPTFGILEGTFTLEDDTGWGGTGRLPVTIIAYDQNADQQALTRRLRRYAQAVARCVLENRNLSNTQGWGVRLLRVDPGPTLGREEPKVFQSFVAVTIELRSEQDTP